LQEGVTQWGCYSLSGHVFNDAALTGQRLLEFGPAAFTRYRPGDGRFKQVCNAFYCRQDNNELSVTTMMLNDIGAGAKTRHIGQRSATELLYQPVFVGTHGALSTW